MNIAAQLSNNQQQRHTYTAEAVFSVAQPVSHKQASDLSNKPQSIPPQATNAVELLDQQFPLDIRTHRDAASYVIDGRHLLIYFADGRHCGLAKAGQFVAYSGTKSSPDAILLKSDTGSHLEVSLKRGCHDRIDGRVVIEDIQLESRATFSNGCSDAPLNGMRHWVSLRHLDKHGQGRSRMEDKGYTAKDGSDYLLSCWFNNSHLSQ